MGKILKHDNWIGTNPYQNNNLISSTEAEVQGLNSLPGVGGSVLGFIYSGLLSDADWGLGATENLIDWVDDIGHFRWTEAGGRFYNSATGLWEYFDGDSSTSYLDDWWSNWQELSGKRGSVHVALNDLILHVERGSLTIKPKLNIAETDMYRDGEDGYGYTYMQFLNTSGVIIKMTAYNSIEEVYDGDTRGEAAEGDVDTGKSLFDGTETKNEVLLGWARTFTTVKLYSTLNMFDLIGKKFKITDIEQTYISTRIVKSDIELTQYTQDTMEETYAKTTDGDKAVNKDTSDDTGLSASVKSTSNNLSADGSETGSV